MCLSQQPALVTQQKSNQYIDVIVVFNGIITQYIATVGWLLVKIYSMNFTHNYIILTGVPFLPSRVP